MSTDFYDWVKPGPMVGRVDTTNANAHSSICRVYVNLLNKQICVRRMISQGTNNLKKKVVLPHAGYLSIHLYISG